MPSVAQGDLVQREVTLRELSQLVGGQVVGDPGVVVRNALPIQDADSTCITLADSDEQALRAEASAACAIVVSKPVVGCTKPLIVVDDVHSAFTKMILRLRPCSAILPRLPAAEKCVSSNATVESSAMLGPGTFVSPGASIAASCTLGRGCFIHPNVTIMEGCRLGDECEIYPSSVLYPGTILGDRVLVHANATLGAFGFGYRQVRGCHQRTAQLGWVEIGSDVEIGAGTTIDRGTYGPTRVGDGTKIDNQVQIGHNCHIGKHNLLCSQVGIAGSCSTGDYVVMGGQVGMADHVHVGSRAMVAARSGLMYDVPEGEVVFGSPAGPRKDKLREVILIGKLPELKRELQELSKKVADLIQRHSTDNHRAA